MFAKGDSTKVLINFLLLFRESAKIFGPRGVCLISLVKLTLPFCVLWLTSNYLYIRALKALNPADVTAVFSSVSAFVYIFSIAMLKEKFFVTRVSEFIFGFFILKLKFVCKSLGNCDQSLMRWWLWLDNLIAIFFKCKRSFSPFFVEAIRRLVSKEQLKLHSRATFMKV